MRSELWETCLNDPLGIHIQRWDDTNISQKVGLKFEKWMRPAPNLVQWRVFVFMFACLCKVYILMDKCNEKLNQIYSFKCRCEIPKFSV